jgi:hypothetical protein
MSGEKFNEKILDDPMFACRRLGDGIMLTFSKSISKQTEKSIIIGLPLDQADKVCRLLTETILVARFQDSEPKKIV